MAQITSHHTFTLPEGNSSVLLTFIVVYNVYTFSTLGKSLRLCVCGGGSCISVILYIVLHGLNPDLRLTSVVSSAQVLRQNPSQNSKIFWRCFEKIFPVSGARLRGSCHGDWVGRHAPLRRVPRRAQTTLTRN